MSESLLCGVSQVPAPAGSLQEHPAPIPRDLPCPADWGPPGTGSHGPQQPPGGLWLQPRSHEPGHGEHGGADGYDMGEGDVGEGDVGGGRSSVSCRRNPLEAPSRAGGGLILPRSPARGGDSSPYTRQDRRSPFAPPLPPQMTWTGSWESSPRISSRRRPKPTAAERGEGSEQAGAAPAAGRVPVPPCLRCVCFGAGEPRGTLRGRVPGGNPSVPPTRC